MSKHVICVPNVSAEISTEIKRESASRKSSKLFPQVPITGKYNSPSSKVGVKAWHGIG